MREPPGMRGFDDQTPPVVGGREEFVDVTLVRELLEGTRRGDDGVELGVTRAPGRPFGTDAENRTPQLMNLEDFLGLQLRHRRAQVGADFHLKARAQNLQRFAYRTAADSELIREILFPDVLAGT